MQLLFDDRYAPLTTEIGALECDLDRSVAAYLSWERGLDRNMPVTFAARDIPGGLAAGLQGLLPLSVGMRRRFLFVSTTSSWTAYFDNGHQGADAFPPMSYLATVLGCRGLKTYALENTRRGRLGRYGGLSFELYGPVGNPMNYVRSVGLANDGGRWTFHQYGEPLPGEATEQYAAAKKKDRFTFADLIRLHNIVLGGNPFSEEFYAGCRCVLVERHGPDFPGERAVSLAEARAHF